MKEMLDQYFEQDLQALHALQEKHGASGVGDIQPFRAWEDLEWKCE